jgi:mono/diheme cytochrome c family protein
MFANFSRKAILACGVLVVLLWAAGAAGQRAPQTTGSQIPPLGLQSFSGRDLYNFYCATCHGRTGRGEGPVAPALKTRPTDLTTLAKRNGGVFPAADVGVLLSGPRRGTLPAHGSAEMPVWGPIFRALDTSDTQAAIRITNLVTYLESIQVK